MSMFNPLPKDLVDRLKEVALPTEDYPFPEDCSTTLICEPMVTFSLDARRTVKYLLDRYGVVNHTHSKWVEYATMAGMSVWKDPRGNFYIDTN